MKLSTGKCECITEPRGDCGLEGYNRNDTYKFEKRKNKYIYYCIWPNANFTEYETCGPIKFKEYFKIVKEYPIVEIKNPCKLWSLVIE